ncbi:hypothetical protein KC345_g2890 [Hortaea werneckii]|nr:hypothetical protein KC345_g2890 [Hortaea werneckii]
MRPIRFLLTLATCIITFFLLLFIGPWRVSTQEDLEERSNLRTYFNWRTPSSLFPPSAIISLTDDNSTFFLARPAAFGPVLPARSLSGQLWVGSGFADDHLRGDVGGLEGELGCSDIPDWEREDHVADSRVEQANRSGNSKRGLSTETQGDQDVEDDEELSQDDGTDDHLHHPLLPSDGLKTNGQSVGKKPTHADIQSLQEGAEIAGKVVLLSRGGCGFLEKVKWVQRRGGVALIVGDDIRGGPLVTMYARGDTSNVTIPALFTSHTTAHLLSSLIPSGRTLDDLSAEEAARLGLALGEQTRQKGTAPDTPNFMTTSVAVKGTSTPKPRQQDKLGKVAQSHADSQDAVPSQSQGWFRSLFSEGGGRGKHEDSRRPPSSGKIGWVLQEEFEDDQEIVEDGSAGKRTSPAASSAALSTKTSVRSSEDGFVIGVQDWRDPDLVAEQKERQKASTDTSTSLSSTVAGTTRAPKHGPKGGSIMPGSGEYGNGMHEAVESGPIANHHAAKQETNTKPPMRQSSNWLLRLFSSKPRRQELKADGLPTKTATKVQDPTSLPTKAKPLHQQHEVQDDFPRHDGLWVTLTPTSMSSSPFFDTLLVLVVSPLVTLTVVYALLLLRSRIRRRRWRAPKSVVERLPVRTYQTMPSTTSSSSSTISAASAPAVSAATPLLPSNARPISTRSRPRARTASEIPAQNSTLRSGESMASPSLDEVEEKRAAGLAEWRRRYGGRQRECVVCLEEYVDGVSRVMSLPCGHEFHEGCITPWLTTRRRTCPICKGDVVRSLARNNLGASASSSSPPPPNSSQPPPLPPQHYHDDPAEPEEGELHEHIAQSRHPDTAAAAVAQQPVSRADEDLEDLERGGWR